jgi:RimJ/RimL family protein N-acetyltransferase
LLTFSSEDSARFSLRIFRAVLPSIDAMTLHEVLRNERVDVAIVRIPASELASIGELERVGLHAIVADTLVHYSLDLRNIRLGHQHVVQMKPLAASQDRQTLERMVREIFSDYVSHYRANPLFPRASIVDGYAEWASRHIQPNDEWRAAWLIENAGDAVGFSCVQTTPDRSEVRATLNGILPAARGRGMYRAMLRATLAHFAALGAVRFKISTQIQNLVVQRVWSSEGFVLDGAENTIHVNALLGNVKSGGYAQR